MDAVIRIHFNEDPDSLDDEEWASRYIGFAALRKMEYENLGAVIKDAFAEFWNAINKK